MADKTPQASRPDMGMRAKTRREELGIPKNRMAVELDIGTSRLSQIERDGVESLSTVERWATVLKVEPAWLAFGLNVKKGSKS